MPDTVPQLREGWLAFILRRIGMRTGRQQLGRKVRRLR
jgi:hypothetical protein